MANRMYDHEGVEPTGKDVFEASEKWADVDMGEYAESMAYDNWVADQMVARHDLKTLKAADTGDDYLVWLENKVEADLMRGGGSSYEMRDLQMHKESWLGIETM